MASNAIAHSLRHIVSFCAYFESDVLRLLGDISVARVFVVSCSLFSRFVVLVPQRSRPSHEPHPVCDLGEAGIRLGAGVGCACPGAVGGGAIPGVAGGGPRPGVAGGGARLGAAGGGVSSGADGGGARLGGAGGGACRGMDGGGFLRGYTGVDCSYFHVA